jgi:peptidoglycan/xylan/chitin deacetylase (PgdA/CDA1 family)
MQDQEQGKLSRLVKLCISIAYFAFRSVCQRTTVGKRPGTCTILYYHSIPPEKRDRFARQMDLLTRLATPVRVDRRHRLSDGMRYAAVTFDDGIENLIESALPELKKRMIPCAIFLIADALGKVPSWMIAPPGSVSELRLMTVDEVRQLSPELVLIGAHTLTHPNLLMLEEENARREICESRLQLERMLHRNVKLFSFPYGAFNKKLVDLCREAGYERIFTTLPYPALSEPGEFVTGRVWVEPTDWPLEFRLKLLGGYAWLPKAFATKRRLLKNHLAARLLGVKSLPVETLHSHVN